MLNEDENPDVLLSEVTQIQQHKGQESTSK